MRRIFIVCLLLVGGQVMISCKGDGGGLPTMPPSPPTPRYNISLIPEEYVGTLDREGKTAFVVVVGPALNRPALEEIKISARNGEVTGIMEDPEFENNAQYRAVIVFARVRPGFSVNVKVGGSEKEISFPIRKIPKCRWRDIPPLVYYTYYQPPSAYFREIMEWGIRFWQLLGVNFIEASSGVPRLVFHDIGRDQSKAEIHCENICNVYVSSSPPEATHAHKHAAAHEIGHALGLDHSPAEEGPKALMSGAREGECGTGISEEPWAWFVHPSRLED